jgi:hypothetical protein
MATLVFMAGSCVMAGLGSTSWVAGLPPAMTQESIMTQEQEPELTARLLIAGIDPADVAVAAAVNHVQLARCAVAEHQHRLVGQIHPHDGLAHR